jgi:uncharacterized protein (DUF1330 family)
MPVPAYIIVLREGPVTDVDAMEQYHSQSRQSGVGHKLTPRVVYGATEALEGKAPDGVVMLEFPTMEEARAWYNSPSYQEALPFRLKAGDYTTFIVEGA